MTLYQKCKIELVFSYFHSSLHFFFLFLKFTDEEGFEKHYIKEWNVINVWFFVKNIFDFDLYQLLEVR